MKAIPAVAGLLSVLLAALWGMPAWARDGVILTGVEGSRDNHSAYLGTVLPLFGQHLGQGLVQRYWLDYTGYRYEKQPFRTIDSEVAGYLGAHYSDTRLSPGDPDNDNQGKQLHAKLQFEGETDLAAGWRGNGIVSYLLGDFNYWARLRVQTTLANRLHVGPELVVQGDAYYDAYKLGLFMGNIPLGERSALTLKGGVSQTLNETASLYLGTEFYIPF
ncbi:MAG: hypothetical protein B7Z35_05990 [Hydrogenophilales bacterium 12-61-10]|nr:MAG: hypothetical protein B7Z35_05990 [Hydrogenophilales bacterium 12-61-10]